MGDLAAETDAALLHLAQVVKATTRELADAMGRNGRAARHVCTVLERRGLVERRGAPPTGAVGRPPLRWALTTRGWEAAITLEEQTCDQP